MVECKIMDKLLLKAMQEISLDGIIIVNKNDDIISFNQRFAIMWGIPDKVMDSQSGKEALEHVLPSLKNPEEFKDRINYLYQNRQDKSHEEINLKDGRTFDRYSSPILNSKGEYCGRIWFYRDITEKKQAQKFLLEEKERFKNIIDSAPFGYYRIGKNRLWEYVNPEWERMHLLKFEEVIGKSFEITQSMDMIEKARENVETVFSGKKLKGEFSRITMNGKIEHHTFNIQPVEIDGEIVAIEGFINDITEQKNKEERINYLNSHDDLTGLFSRSYFEKALKDLDKEENCPISVIVVDTNGLKVINDNYGHAMGDEFLKSCANILLENCRKEDFVSRWGGDEFIIILPKTNKIEANEICKRISETNGYVQNLPISMATGIGVKERIGEDIRGILKEAEDAMYKHKLSEKGSSSYGIIDSLLGTLAQKSHETREHTYRMQKHGIQIAKKLELSETEMDNLNLSILMHDIGKISISEKILMKEELLTPSDWEEINQHPIKGYQIALSTNYFAHIAENIYSHHERWDGNGYPRGLKNNNIPLMARIIAVIDAYDVMSNGSSYKAKMPKDLIIQEFEETSGKQFDPKIVNAFISILKTKS